MIPRIGRIHKGVSNEVFLDSCAVGDRNFCARACNTRRRPGDGFGPKGTAQVTIEGYGPSSAIVCDQAGTTCWHSVERYDYPPNANVVVHPYDWQWDSGANYVWREHTGRGYWQGEQWQQF
jgi:hypothetical protein